MQKKYLNKHISNILAIFIFIGSGQSWAFSEYEAENEISMEGWKPIEVTGDAISWKIFATTKEKQDCHTDEYGIEYCTATPEYSNEIKKFDGKEVTLMGYMFPLEQSDNQKNFLIGPYPLSCPFEYHVGASQVVEVFADKPIEFTYDPITIKGKLKVAFAKETNVFYHLEGAIRQ